MYGYIVGNEKNKMQSFPYILLKSSEPQNFYTAELLLNQARAWFHEITLMRTLVCVCMCCVSAPQAIKN